MKTRAPILLVLLVAATAFTIQATSALADQDGTKNKALSAVAPPAPTAKAAAKPAARSSVTPAAMKQTSAPPHASKTAAAAPAKAPAVTVWQGELIDEACYSKTGARGDAHAECAAKCARGGSPVGLLDAKGKVLTILAPAAALADHMGHEVRISGKVDSRMNGILPEKIEVKAGTEWQAVALPATP